MLAGLLAGWLAGWLGGWLVGWLAGWQAGGTPNVIVSQKCINFIAKTYRCEHISCPSYRLAGQLAGWLAGRLPAMRLGHQNASKTCTLSTKVRRKCVPLSRKSISNRVGWRVEGVKNAYPLAESASKTRTLKQKVRFEASKTCTLRQKVCQKHVPLGRKSAPVELRGGNEPPEVAGGGGQNRVPLSKQCVKNTYP